ncbi:probable serine/threonine-protein kinase DDB_G0282963 isoform X1 [Silurus meridionalis]|uniref:Fibrinogen C-terminal domain-containing protein n=1 Tax=Silurus meridionalis TaxID=175797 RepID=A0A8T0BMS7_SILME|nr:probable serine/threonine-protein kinase DDB_G0282963 isoform X1 [Silurus meridionalis]KAF7707553.1 hypothetical protein HF521_018771 [Silurus meridionalis]
MLLSVLSLWGSLLTLVASQSCPDPSENSASWVRLKPLGQCKDGESTCPYRITLPSLTIQLPKPFRDLEKMVKELQSLTQMVNQLREDCRGCKERQGMDWSTSTDDEREDGERIQASKKTFNTRESQQDIAQREHTVQVTTSRSAVEDSMVISSEAKDENPTAFGKQWNTNQERNVNQHTTKPRSEKNGGTKGFDPLREKTISGSISKVGEVPSLTTTYKKILQFPMAKLTESSIPRDREQPTQESQKQSQGQSITNKVRNEMYPGTLTAKGKVKSIPEYHVLTTEDVDDNDDDKEYDNEDDDDDVETKQLQTPKGENVPGEKQPVTGTDAQNHRELKPRIKQLPRKQQDKENKKAVADTGLKESRSSIFEDTNNKNVAKEGSVSIIQEPTFKNMKKNNHGERSTKVKVLKPGSHSESQVNLRPVNTDDTIRGQKKLTSPNTGRANASVNVSQINPQTLEIKSKNAFKSKLDGKMDTGVKLKFNSSETVNGQVMTTSTIAGMTYGIVDASPTNPKTLDSIKQLNTSTDLESGIQLNSANTTDSVSGVKNPGSLDSINARPNVDLINTNIQKGKFQTPLKSGTDVESNTGMDSNTVNRQNNSRLSISEITDGIVDVSQTNPQILDSKNQEDTNLESETIRDSNPIKNNDTVSVKNNSGLSVSDSIHAKADPKKQSNSQSSLQSSKNGTSSTEINSNSVNGIKNSRAPISVITDDIIDISLTNPQTAHGKDQVKTGTDPRNDDKVVSNPVNNIKTVSGQDMSSLPISDITYGIVDDSPKNHQIDQKNKFRTGTDSESDVVRHSNPVQNIATTNGQKNLRASISDRANSTADIDLINLPSLNSPKPFTNGIDAKSNNGMDSHISITSETVSQLQTPKSPFSGITDAVAGNQTYPGTFDSNGFKNPFKPLINKERKNKTDSNALKVETNRSLEMPQLSISDRPDAPDNVNQINPQTVYNNFKNTTEVSTPFNNAGTNSQLETPKSPVSDRSHATSDQINPQEIDYITKTTIKPGANSETKAEIHPNRDHTVDTVSQQERSESSISDSRRDVNGTNHSLNSKYDLPKKRNPKLNVTQPRNGKFRIPNPTSIDNERRKEQSSNTTTSLRNDAKKSGRHVPTGDLPTSQGKRHEMKHQPERTSTGRINIRKDPRHRKPYILQRIPLNESKAFGSGGTKNTSGIIDYIMSQTESSTNNELNSTVYSMGQSVRPTLAPQGVVDEAHLKRTAPTVAVVHTRVNHQIESTSQATTTKRRPEHTGGHSGHSLVLDEAKNLERGSKLPLVEKKKDTHRRTEQVPFKTSRVDSNQEKPEKSLREGSNQHFSGKTPLVVISNERNGLNYATTAATPYTINTEFKNKFSKTPQFTAPIITTPHLMDQDHAEQAKTTSGVKVSNKQAHHRLENPSQEIESKRSHSDTGNKELQSASNGQESSAVTDLQPNSLDTIQNIENGSTALILDKVMAGPGSKVSTTSSKHTHENRARDTNTVAMDKVETITEAIPLTPSADNAPVTNQSKTPLGSTDLVVGNNGKHAIDKNNVNRMTGTSLDQMPAGHTNDGSNKKPLTVNSMDNRQGIEKQLLSNCHDQCDRGPTPQSILNSHESSKDNRDKLPQDCSDFMKNPKSGIYNVTPTGSCNTTFPVFCDMKSSGGGWTLIQHRLNGNISFNRTWNDYKGGFGNLMGEFWLGNDKIHWLTTTKAMALRIELEDLDGIKEYAQYDQFHVANESQYYRLTIEGYSGTAGDAMLYSKKFNHNQKNFTTPDRDNDQYTSGNCGAYYSSGWWFDACMAANLNGKYYETRYKGVRNGIFWGTWHNISTESYPTNERQSFKTVRMMIRPRAGLLMD